MGTQTRAQQGGEEAAPLMVFEKHSAVGEFSRKTKEIFFSLSISNFFKRVKFTLSHSSSAAVPTQMKAKLFFVMNYLLNTI